MAEQPADGPVLGQVVLRPDVYQAGVWTVLSALATSSALYAVLQRPSPWWGYLLTIGTGLLTILVSTQVFAPSWWTIVLDRFGARGRVAGLHVDRSFAGVRAVEITYRFGEPRLVLRGHGGPRDRRIVLLPIGVDVKAGRRLLAQLEAQAASVGQPSPFDAQPGPNA